jgi:uncharacterized membrane protein (DUF4010 family)
LQLVLAFQIVLYLTGWVGERFGASGILASSAVVGLTDVDALIYSMVKLGSDGVMISTAAKALAIGVLTNTVLKLGLAWGVGRGVFCRVTGAGLSVLSAASLAALLLFP